MKPVRYPRKRTAGGRAPKIAPPPGAGASVRGAGPSAVPKRASPESDLQEQGVSLLRLMLPEPCRVFSIPNGAGKLGGRYAAGLKRAGLLAGVHDVGIIGPGFFATIETKSATGRIRPEQRDFGEAMRLCGHMWFVARSLDDFHGAAMLLGREHMLALRPVTLTPGGFIWDRGPR